MRCGFSFCIHACMRACAFLSQNDTVFHYFNSNVHSNFPFPCRIHKLNIIPCIRHYYIDSIGCLLQGGTLAKTDRNDQTFDNVSRRNFWIFSFCAAEAPHSAAVKEYFFGVLLLTPPIHPLGMTMAAQCLIITTMGIIRTV